RLRLSLAYWAYYGLLPPLAAAFVRPYQFPLKSYGFPGAETARKRFLLWKMRFSDAKISPASAAQVAGDDFSARGPKPSRALIVDKPSVCQRGLPGRLQIKDLRPATGTGMHFYRKCKHLLCKKCQK